MRVCVCAVVDTESEKAKKEDWVGKSTTTNHFLTQCKYCRITLTLHLEECYFNQIHSEKLHIPVMSFSLFFILLQEEEIHRNNKKPQNYKYKGNWRKKQQNKHYIFSIVLSALTKPYTTYINTHSALTRHWEKIRILPTFVNINLYDSFFYWDLKVPGATYCTCNICTESTMKTHGTDNMRQEGCNTLWNPWTLHVEVVNSSETRVAVRWSVVKDTCRKILNYLK